MKIIEQDITRVEKGIVVQQVNTLGIMGAGLAKQFAAIYPKMYRDYRRKCLDKKMELGDIFYYCGSKEPLLIVANVAGQKTIGRTGLHTSYDALDRAFASLLDFYRFECPKDFPIYFPFKLGAGLGGGDWTTISAKIEKFFPNALICKVK